MVLASKLGNFMLGPSTSPNQGKHCQLAHQQYRSIQSNRNISRKHNTITGSWFQPLWKILVSWKDYSPIYGKIKHVPNHQSDYDMWDIWHIMTYLYVQSYSSSTVDIWTSDVSWIFLPSSAVSVSDTRNMCSAKKGSSDSPRTPWISPIDWIC